MLRWSKQSMRPQWTTTSSSASIRKKYDPLEFARKGIFVVALILILATLTNWNHHDNTNPKLHRRTSRLFNDWESILQKGMAKNAEVSFRLYDFRDMDGTQGPPPFLYPVQDTLHSADYIVLYEWEVVKRWMKALRKAQEGKKQDSSATTNCLDIGANGGFYSLMSRAAGCRTLAVDAQPRCLQRLSSAAALNGFSTDFDVEWTAVGEDTKQFINVGATKCSGLWAVVASDWINDESSETVNVSMTPLLQIVQDWIIDDTDMIDVFKIDVEGSEMAVLPTKC